MPRITRNIIMHWHRELGNSGVVDPILPPQGMRHRCALHIFLFKNARRTLVEDFRVAGARTDMTLIYNRLTLGEIGIRDVRGIPPQPPRSINYISNADTIYIRGVFDPSMGVTSIVNISDRALYQNVMRVGASAFCIYYWDTNPDGFPPDLEQMLVTTTPFGEEWDPSFVTPGQNILSDSALGGFRSTARVHNGIDYRVPTQRFRGFGFPLIARVDAANAGDQEGNLVLPGVLEESVRVYELYDETLPENIRARNECLQATIAIFRNLHVELTFLVQDNQRAEVREVLSRLCSDVDMSGRMPDFYLNLASHGSHDRSVSGVLLNSQVGVWPGYTRLNVDPENNIRNTAPLFSSGMNPELAVLLTRATVEVNTTSTVAARHSALLGLTTKTTQLFRDSEIPTPFNKAVCIAPLPLRIDLARGHTRESDFFRYISLQDPVIAAMMNSVEGSQLRNTLAHELVHALLADLEHANVQTHYAESQLNNYEMTREMRQVKADMTAFLQADVRMPSVWFVTLDSRRQNPFPESPLPTPQLCPAEWWLFRLCTTYTEAGHASNPTHLMYSDASRPSRSGYRSEAGRELDLTSVQIIRSAFEFGFSGYQWFRRPSALVPIGG